MNGFYAISSDELYLIQGGCGLCTAGAIIGGAATGAGIAFAFTPVGWVVAGGALIGGVLGYLAS